MQARVEALEKKLGQYQRSAKHARLVTWRSNGRPDVEVSSDVKTVTSCQLRNSNPLSR